MSHCISANPFTGKPDVATLFMLTNNDKGLLTVKAFYGIYAVTAIALAAASFCIYQWGGGWLVNFFLTDDVTMPLSDAESRQALVNIFGTGAAFLVLLAPALQSILTGKTPHPFWFCLTGTAFVAAIYLLSVNNRIYSWHGFIHGAIVYQILEGNIPPMNPFCAGEPLGYPWLYEGLVAFLCRVFQLSPYVVFALLNIACAAASMLLTYAIAQQITKDRTTSTLATLFVLFASACFSRHGIVFLQNVFDTPLETRAFPAICKFSNVNATPIGIVFFLGLVYGLIRIICSDKIFISCGIILSSFVLGGLLYPPMVIGAGAAFAATLFVCLLTRPLFYKKRLTCLFISLVIGSLLIWIHMRTLVSTHQHLLYLSTRWQFLNKLITCLFFFIPAGIILFIERQRIKSTITSIPVKILAAIALFTIISYLCPHLPLSSEYKYLLLAGLMVGFPLTIGVVGVIRQHRVIAAVLLIAFAYPAYADAAIKILRVIHWERPFSEEGMRLVASDAVQRELHEWLIAQTSDNCVVIDRDPTLPVFTGRPLYFVPHDVLVNHKGFKNPFLTKVSRVDPELLEKRKALFERIYDKNIFEPELRKSLQDSLHTTNFVYFIARDKGQMQYFDDVNMVRLFTTRHGDMAVYQFGEETNPNPS